MSFDIDPIVRDWPYLPDEITVRVIEGEDGQRRIQLRLDLGLLQMSFDGRPDGRRIHDADSWLEYHQRRQRDHDSANPDGAPYLLEPEDCAELLREVDGFEHDAWAAQSAEVVRAKLENRAVRLIAGPRPANETIVEMVNDPRGFLKYPSVKLPEGVK